jgi:methylated-DNA-[protein]-cysteine S-methyltransferase
MSLRYTTIDSPLGDLLLAGENGALSHLWMLEGRHPVVPRADWVEDDAAFAAATRQLGEYFAGERATFELELALEGTDFQLRAWNALRAIPYGETRSYGEQARRIGSPRAVRAVGLANGQNPIAIIVPCHRVLGADGSLTGFGGGLENKRRLLDLEAGVMPLARL